MKYLFVSIILIGISCSSLPVSEPASQAYSESLMQKAESIRSNPNSTQKEREAADDLTLAANLIRVTGKQSARDQNEIKDLREEKGQNDMLEWLIYMGIGIFILWLIGIIIRRRFA